MFLMLTFHSVVIAAAVFVVAGLATPGRRGAFIGAALAIMCLVFV